MVITECIPFFINLYFNKTLQLGFLNETGYFELGKEKTIGVVSELLSDSERGLSSGRDGVDLLFLEEGAGTIKEKSKEKYFISV